VAVAFGPPAVPGAADDGSGPVYCTPETLTNALEGPPPAGRADELESFAFRITIPGLANIVDEPPAQRPSPGLVALEQRLSAIIAASGVQGRFAVAVTDFQTGETIGVNLDRVQRSGCVMNLFAIVAALRDVDAGRYPLSAVDATIRQTIWASDATAARSLYRAVGGGDAVAGVGVVARLMRDTLGMPSSLVDHPPAFPQDSIGAGPDNLVTARDMNHALYRIYRDDVLSPALVAYLVEAMTHVKPGLNYLTAVIAPAATVSHKNGFFWEPAGWVDNDTAIVRFGDSLQYAYAFTFLSEAVPVLYQDVPLAQQLVREAWEYFRTAYAAALAPP
jgi:beta-lactamase class A